MSVSLFRTRHMLNRGGTILNEHSITLSRRAFMGGGALFAASFFLGPTPAFGVTAAEKQAEADAALASLTTMETQLDEAEMAYHTAVQEPGRRPVEDGRGAGAHRRGQRPADRFAGASEHAGAQHVPLGFHHVHRLPFGRLDVPGVHAELEHPQPGERERRRHGAGGEGTCAARSRPKRPNTRRRKRWRPKKPQRPCGSRTRPRPPSRPCSRLTTTWSAEAAQLLEEERAAREAAEAAEAAARAEESARQAEQQQQQENHNTPSNNPNNGGGGGQPAYQGSDPYDRACSYLGRASYVWGACSPGAFDCSGFVSYCLTGQYNRVGTTYDFMTWPQVSDPQPGDVCTNWQHCGIYAGRRPDDPLLEHLQ